MPCYRSDLEKSLDIIYEGQGARLAEEFYIPVLKRTVHYDRLSGYFSADALVVIATGIAGLIRNNGRMRLIVGLHDVGPELVEAYRLSREKAEAILQDIGERVSEDLEKLADVIARRRIEAVAWMLANGFLEIKVALPKRTFLGLGNGIFHEKLMIFRDSDGCVIEAAGSANETRQAYEVNGENLTVHMSWVGGHMEYVRRYTDRFETLWNGNHPDYMVFGLPEVVERKLREKFYPPKVPEYDPLEDEEIRRKYGVVDYAGCRALAPLAKFVKELGNVREFALLGIGPVILHPHQAFAVDYVLSRYPHRVLLADEVGLGKTIEAGAVIKRLLSSGRVQRVIILAPKNLARQWLDEMWTRFGLRFWLLDTVRKAYVTVDGAVHKIDENINPFDVGGIDLVVASWHYARGSRKRSPELLEAKKFFDLVVVDEAHHVRRKRYAENGLESTRLFELVTELGVASPHILLLTATPVQLYAGEAMDLLMVLGIGGPWVHEDLFETYFRVLVSGDEAISRRDALVCLRMVSWVARRYVGEKEVDETLRSILGENAELVKHALLSGGGLEKVADTLDSALLKRVLIALNPLRWLIVRNSRSKLEQVGYVFPRRDVSEVAVELSAEHKALLDRLDRYLREYYGLYEKSLRGINRSVVGFVKSVYHQRFTSSFTAAYLTIRDRLMFLRALVNGDRDAVLAFSSKILADVESDWDEDELVDAMDEVFNKVGRENLLREVEELEELERLLRDFSPHILSLNDPKLRQVALVTREFVDKGDKVLVFSKYTDTVEAVVRYLVKGGYFSEDEIAIYTGEGGKLYDRDRGEYVLVTKDDVVRELEGGSVKVLVCSDAAGEGLNLQAASVVVNVDMPWNPAKVEQRIGRVDRLGQEAKVVYVRNIWYPESIEAEMYRRLFLRKELYELVVGPAQEIISEGLRKAFDEGATFQSLRKVVDETIKSIEEIKENVSRFSGFFSGAYWTGKGYELLKDVVERLREFVVKACRVLNVSFRFEGDYLVFDTGSLPSGLERWNRVSVKVGGVNTLTPAHPIVQWLCDSILSYAGGKSISYDKSLYLVREYDGLWRVRLISYDGGAPEELDVRGILRVLDELLGVLG